MTDETHDPDKDVFHELDDDRLRQSVEQIRGNPAPQDAVDRAVERAQELTRVGLAVRRQPAIAGRRFGGIRTFVGMACLLLFLGMLVQSISQSVVEMREAARRTPAVNDLKQIGLAMHNYHETNGVPQLLSGNDGRYRFAVQQPENYFVDGAGASQASKIIHSAEIVLVVDEITSTEALLVELLEQFDGYVGNSQILEPQGQQRSAQWVVHVPAERRNAFLQEVVKLGTPENRTTNSRDVTEEFVDLTTRIESKKQLEQRILGLLEKQAGDIKDVLAVEEQLARVREEIEKMQGRVDHIDAVTTMTSITISAREEHDYVPPQAPSFSTEVGQTWTDSMALLQDFGKSVVFATVAIAPWLPLIAIFVFLVRRWMKRRKDRMSA